MTSGIYQILNSYNSKSYIGSAIDVKRRWWIHLSKLRKGIHVNKYLQNAFNKYGESSFNFIVLETLTPEELIPLEQFYLDSFRPEYNLSPTAGSLLGIKRSEEFKERVSIFHSGKTYSEESRWRMSVAQKKRFANPENRQKMSDAKRGKFLSEEHKRRISDSGIGRIVSEETRKKISEAHIGKRQSEEHRKKNSEARKRYYEAKHVFK